MSLSRTADRGTCQCDYSGRHYDDHPARTGEGKHHPWQLLLSRERHACFTRAMTAPALTLSTEIADGALVPAPIPPAAKSTSLRMLCGPGRTSTPVVILIGDRDVTDVQPDRDMPWSSRTTALYPHMTAHDNMGSPSRRRHPRLAEIDKRVREAARSRPDRSTGSCLGALRWLAPRGGHGRAIVRKPKVSLMDELLSNLTLSSVRWAPRSPAPCSLGVTTVYAATLPLHRGPHYG